MKKFLKLFPVEMYVIFIPSLTFFMVVGVGYLTCALNTAEICSDYFSRTHFLFTSYFLSNIILLIAGSFLLYLIYTIIIFLILIKTPPTISVVFFQIKSFLFHCVVLYSGLAATALLMQIIFFTADPVRTENISNILMNYDMKVFGVYPAFFLHTLITSITMGDILYYSYMALVPIIIAALLVTIFLNKQLYRSIIIGYFLTTFVGLLLCAYNPAISPDLMYRKNILHGEIPKTIQEVITSTKISPNMENKLSELEKYWYNPEGKFLPVSTFPSMHAAWGVIVTVVLIKLWWPLAIVAIPWVIAMLIGTTYTMEHYGVDVIFGILLGLGVVFVTKKLLTFEEKYFSDKYKIFSVFDQFNENVKVFVTWIIRLEIRIEKTLEKVLCRQ